MPPGYVTDTPYADTFFRELSPAWLNYVGALNGVAPIPLVEPFTYLELGCGLGTSTIVNAGAFPHAEFHACDFNAEHVDAGRRYAATLGIRNVTFHQESFDEIARGRRPEGQPLNQIPQADFVVLHGVYSWVDAGARAAIRRIIERLLKPAGLAYVSFNALPGWSAELPLRRLLVELAATTEGNSAVKAEAAARVMKTLSAAGLRYFTANPAATLAIEAYARGEGHYLAHEFMNAAWEPFYAADVAVDFAAIGLRRVGSATLPDNHLPLVLDARSADAIATLATDDQRTLALDFATNQRFRRDVFARVARPAGASADAGMTYLERTPIGCAADPEGIGFTARVPRGEIRFQETFIGDVRALMARGSWTFGALVASLSARSSDTAGVTRNLQYLVAAGALVPFARAETSHPAEPTVLAGAVVERSLRDIVSRGRRRAVPAAIHGNGVEMDVEDARALLAWAADGTSSPALSAARLATFARVGVLA